MLCISVSLCISINAAKKEKKAPCEEMFPPSVDLVHRLSVYLAEAKVRAEVARTHAVSL